MVVGLFAALSESSGTATAPDSSSTAPTTAGGANETAAGKPCVALADELPAGAPAVDVPIGPPPTSLKITDITTGTGPAVTAADTVTVNYIGVSCSTGAIFDESYSRRQPATFGLDQVIAGWTEGLQGMQAGGARRLVIPPDMGYGSSGQGAKIGPDETLVFVVELLSITPPA